MNSNGKKLTVTIDSHQIGFFKQCEQLFQLTQIDNWESKLAKKGLTRGTVFHKLMSLYYKNKKNKKDVKETIKEAFILTESLEELNNEDKELLQTKLIDYCSFYSGQNWEIIAVESDEKPCPTGFSFLLYEDCNVRMIYEGRIDLVIRIQGTLAYVDHKTQAFGYDINERVDAFPAYATALNCRLGIINYVGLQKTKEPKDCFRQEFVPFSKPQLNAWREETIKWIFRLIRAKITGEWLQNRSACKTVFGDCAFKKICDQTNREAIQIMLNTNFQQKEEVWKAW